MVKRSSRALMVAGMMVAAPVAAQGPGPCGVPDANARADVIKIMTLPVHAFLREEMQLTGLTPDHLVDLGGNPGDTSVCESLRATLTPGMQDQLEGPHPRMTATMYRAGERYIAALRSTPNLGVIFRSRGPDQIVSYTLDFEGIFGIVGGVEGVSGTEFDPAGQLERLNADLASYIANVPASNDKLEDVIAKIEGAVEELRKSPPDRQAGMGNIEGAAGDLEAAVNEGSVASEEGTQFLITLTDVARRVAVRAIANATRSGEKPSEISEAQDFLAEGDSLASQEKHKDAVAKYKDAVAKAEAAVS